MKLTGHTILITGGGTGIGRALAEKLHERGNRIIVTGRREAPLRALAADRPGISWAVMDVADPADIVRFASTVIADHPDLDVLINNAGIMQVEDLTADPVDLGVIEATVATNFLGPLRLTAALLPHLKTRPNAAIVTVTSGLAFVPLAATPTYSATKAAIHSWTQSLRHQLRDTGIEVLELAPPGVATDLMPGHADNPASMPLGEYISEVLGLMESEATPHGEILVERVKPLRFAEANGYDTVFSRLNGV